jgi:hypothetical protein
MRRIRPIPALAATLCALAAAAAPAPAAISYRTLFQDPGPSRTPDLSLDDHAIALIDATPAGEQVRFTFRDFNSRPIADALIAADLRHVDVRGVIDGGERDQAPVQAMVAAIGADRVVVCGERGGFNSCIASSEFPSLMHNKFLTFSPLAGGRGPIVLQTSKNFLAPSQLTYYNDMVEIEGDVPLYEAYASYFDDLQAQVRSVDHFIVAPAFGPNTIFTSPRFQPDRETSDTIVERMDEIDCSEGGSATGHGLIRVANMAFRSERAVIMRKLVALRRQGCEIDVIATNLDGDILAGLASAGVRVRPFFLRRLSAAQPQVIVHSKFWLVDARSTLTGRRTKVVYAGSSNWRADQQRSDDLLLRMVDDAVYEAYAGYWEKIRDRVASDQATPASDTRPPVSVLTPVPASNAAGWNRDDVTVRVAASDGHNVQNSGLRRLRVALSGAQTGTWDLAGEQDAHRLAELPITAEGTTTVTFFAEDRFGNVETERSHDVRIDRTPPGIAGLPTSCELWPPNHEMVEVADVIARDDGAGLAGLTIDARGGDGEDDVEVDGGSVSVRAEKGARGRSRTYTITASATDLAGNVAEASAECVVPRSQAR